MGGARERGNVFVCVRVCLRVRMLQCVGVRGCSCVRVCVIKGVCMCVRISSKLHKFMNAINPSIV